MGIELNEDKGTEESNMKRTYSLGLYEKAMPAFLTWEEKLIAAKEAGYDFVEISIDETDEKLSRLEWTKEERLKLVETMKKVGISIRTMCLSGHRKYPMGSNKPEICAKGMEIMEKAIQLADDLGIRIIQLAGYDVFYENSSCETELRFRKNLKCAVEIAEKSGVMMGFETMETEFMNTIEKAMQYVKDVNSPYLGVYPDVGNITNAARTYDTNVLCDIHKGSGHLIAVHLKETLPGKFREITFGTGHVDFKSVIEETWKLGVRRYVTEFWYKDSPKWKEDLDFAIHMMRPILDYQNSKKI